MRLWRALSLLVAGLSMAAALSACTNRPLSLIDTDWLTGNTHAYSVLDENGEPQYAED